jgi:hypothetical protein
MAEILSQERVPRNSPGMKCSIFSWAATGAVSVSRAIVVQITLIVFINTASIVPAKTRNQGVRIHPEVQELYFAPDVIPLNLL